LRYEFAFWFLIMFKKILLPFCILVIVALVMNPHVEYHQAAFKEKFAQLNPIAGTFGVGTIVGGQLQYHTFGVGSYTKLDKKLATIGFFNNVFIVIPDKELDIKSDGDIPLLTKEKESKDI